MSSSGIVSTIENWVCSKYFFASSANLSIDSYAWSKTGRQTSSYFSDEQVLRLIETESIYFEINSAVVDSVRKTVCVESEFNVGVLFPYIFCGFKHIIKS